MGLRDELIKTNGNGPTLTDVQQTALRRDELEERLREIDSTIDNLYDEAAYLNAALEE